MSVFRIFINGKVSTLYFYEKYKMWGKNPPSIIFVRFGHACNVQPFEWHASQHPHGFVTPMQGTPLPLHVVVVEACPAQSRQYFWWALPLKSAFLWGKNPPSIIFVCFGMLCNFRPFGWHALATYSRLCSQVTWEVFETCPTLTRKAPHLCLISLSSRHKCTTTTRRACPKRTKMIEGGFFPHIKYY